MSLRSPWRPGGPPADIKPAVLDLPSAAQYLGVSPRTLATLKSTGEIPFVQLARCIGFTRADLAAYKARKRRTR